MYGTGIGIGPPREGIYGQPVGTDYKMKQDGGPLFSGVNGQGNSLTMDGPATSPSNVNDIDNKRMKLALAMAGAGMTGYAQGMQNGMPIMPLQSSSFDIYGNPLSGGQS